MKTYMNKKNSETVTLIAVTSDSRYIIETAAGAQKSYSESSFKKMFKFIEEVDDNQTALDITDTTDAETTETEADTSSDEAVEVVVDDTTEGEPDYTDEPVPAPADNGWEKIAKTNIKNCYNWIIGELENTLQDLEEDDPEHIKAQNTLDDTDYLIDEIYHESITTLYTKGSCGGKAPTEMRFAGRDFCRNLIIKLLKKDGYYTPVVAKKTKKSVAAPVDNILVTMVAFTGMNIGNFSAIKDGNGYAVTTKAGKTLHFDECGVQTDAKNPKFGNKLIFA